MNCVMKWNKLIIHSQTLIVFCDQLVERHQCAIVFTVNFKAEDIQEVTSNPSLVKVTTLRMQVNGD